MEVEYNQYDTTLEECRSNPDGLKGLMNMMAAIGTHSSPQIMEKYRIKIHEVISLWIGKIDYIPGLIQLNEAIANYFMTNFKASVGPGKSAINEFIKINNEELLGLGYMILGSAYRGLGLIDEAVNYLYKCVAQSFSEMFIIFKCYGHYHLGEINIGIEDFQTAREHYIKARNIGEKTTINGVLDPLFRIYNGLGNIEMVEGHYDLALQYFKKSLIQRFASEFQTARTYCDLGTYYLLTGDLDKSIENVKKSYNIRMSLNFLDAATTSLLTWSETLIEKGDYAQAIELLKEAEVNCIQFNSQMKLSRCYKLRAQAEQKFKNFENSVLYYEKYVEIENDQQSKQIQRIYKLKNNMIQKQKQEIEEAHHEIKDSINYAKRIQDAIMPGREDMLNVLGDAFVLYLPKDVVAGDFFWMEKVDETIYLAAADCTGHGVPGAMVSVVCSNALTKALLEEGIRDTGKLLDRTRELVISQLARSGEEVKDGMDISLVALENSAKAKKENENFTYKISWSGANNSLWVLRKGTDDIEEIKANKQPIGISPYPTPFTTHTIELNEGDVIYLFTDGYQDQFGGPRGKKFKASQLKRILLENHSLSMYDQQEVLNSTFNEWKGSLEQIDDVCVIGVRV